MILPGQVIIIIDAYKFTRIYLNNLLIAMFILIAITNLLSMTLEQDTFNIKVISISFMSIISLKTTMISRQHFKNHAQHPGGKCLPSLTWLASASPPKYNNL